MQCDPRSGPTALDALKEPGGIGCLWRKPSTDIEAWYAQWPSDQVSWDTLSADLLAAGATESDGAYAGVHQPEYNSALTYRDGTVYYVSPARLFSSVLTLQQLRPARSPRRAHT